MITTVIKSLPIEISKLLIGQKLDKLSEIRLRVGQRLVLRFEKMESILKYVVKKEDLSYIITSISNNSIYAIQHDMNLGYITTEGGNRIGITGEIIMSEGKIKNIKNISSMNIRISHELTGVALPIIDKIINCGSIKNTLIISPPGCGKTTLLRDCIRYISDFGKNVGVADERGEIASVYCGIPTMNIGTRTDVISFCPKNIGMSMLLRSMAPDVLATDEIGNNDDVLCIKQACTCGVSVIATAHASNIDDCMNNLALRELVSGKYFDLVVVMSNNRKIGEITNIIEVKELCKREVKVC